MHSSEPLVSVVAVVAGEPVERLRAMVDSVAHQDAEAPIQLIVAAPAADHPTIRTVVGDWNRGPVTLLVNAGGERSRGLNACLAEARGGVIVRVDARSRLAPDHVRRCVERLRSDPAVAVVGGHQIATAPSRAGTVARGIARALRHPFLLGGAAYRDPGSSGPVDTVYLGAFRADDATRFPYDVDLLANEDYDLCQRVRAAGGTVFLEPGLDVAYEPRPTLAGLAAQYRAFGRAKTAYWRARGRGPRGRQLAAVALAVLGALGAVVAAVVWPPALAVGLTVLAVAFLAADALGDRTPAGVGTHLAALAAHVVIETSWCTGVLAEWVAPRTSGDVEHALERDACVRRGDRVDRDLVEDLAPGQ